jgi:hypothetical protein
MRKLAVPSWAQQRRRYGELTGHGGANRSVSGVTFPRAIRPREAPREPRAAVITQKRPGTLVSGQQNGDHADQEDSVKCSRAADGHEGSAVTGHYRGHGWLVQPARSGLVFTGLIDVPASMISCRQFSCSPSAWTSGGSVPAPAVPVASWYGTTAVGVPGHER